jgi:predicted TIM-barrel fold metal-dependent hydrolase
MKIICVEEHAIDPATDKAARPAALDEAPYFGLMDSPAAASTPRNDHRPTMVALPEALELAADIGDGRIKHMDEHGIQMQVVSYGSLAQLVPVGQAVALTQAANNRLAEAIGAHPARLSGFAALPWQDPQAAAAELDRSVTQLGLKGVLLLGRPGATFLDDPKYAPVLKKLNDLNVPLYAHPGIPLPDVQQAYYSGFSPQVTAQFSLTGWGWHHEAGLQVLRLILSGAFEKYPGLQIISGHWGEMVPFWLPRLDDMLPPNITGLSQTITQTYLNHLWVTPSGLFDLPQFQLIHTVIGADRIIWSVDYPYLTMDGTREFLGKLPVSEQDREKIAHLNAEKLFTL